MKFIKNILKIIIVVPVVYILVALILMLIPVNRSGDDIANGKSIWLETNGVHLSIILRADELDLMLKEGLVYEAEDQYLSFGWGDKNFYINTPTWRDLTLKNALRAMFVKGPTLLHLTRYSNPGKDWVEVKVSEEQFIKLNQYLRDSFISDSNGNKILMQGAGYSFYDDFYEAKGNFSFFKTCNTWVNDGLKQSGIKSCLWTPFDFGLLNLHER